MKTNEVTLVVTETEKDSDRVVATKTMKILKPLDPPGIYCL